jgi:hypothetical protein
MAKTGLIVFLMLAATCGCSRSHPVQEVKTPAPSATDPATPAVSSPSASETKTPNQPENLVVPPAVRQQLIATYETTRNLSANAVSGTRPGSVFYALDPSTGVHWAVANFSPSSEASEREMVSFQDGGSIGSFREEPSGTWILLGAAGAPPDCTHYIPLPVRSVWKWPSGPGCGV